MVTSEPQIVQIPAQRVIEIRETVPMEALPSFFPRAYSALEKYVDAHHVEVTGMPLAITHGMPDDKINIAAAFPVQGATRADGEVKPSAIPEGTAATLTLTGSYEELASAYDRLREWMTANGHEPGQLAWEQYVTVSDPSGDPDRNVTNLYWLVACE